MFWFTFSVYIMQLSDLPIELLVRVLPIEDYLLDLPNEIIIPWLNLLPQVESFRILGDSGCGIMLTKERPKAYTTISGKICTKYGNCFEEVDAALQKVFEKFAYKIFIIAGQPIEAKYYKKYIIFDFETVRHLICEYYPLSSCLQIWTGCDLRVVDLCIPYFVWNEYENIKKLSVFHPSRFHVAPELIKFSNSWFNDNELLNQWAILSCCQDWEQCIENLEITMSVDEFIEMKNNVSYMLNLLQPKEVRIHLNLVENRAGGEESTKHPTDFPIEWITDLLVVNKVQIFTLHYFESHTTFNALGKLLREMPLLLELDLSFGKLDLENVAGLVPFRKNDCHIQVKVDKSFFDTYQFRYNKSVWKIDIEDTFVEARYVKRAFGRDSTAEPLTFARCIGLWLEYRRRKRKQRRGTSVKHARGCKDVAE